MPLSHLREGDVVFTADAHGTAMHRVISMAQHLGNSSGHKSSVHAALATGQNTNVLESVGSGLRLQPLSGGDYRIYCYRGPKRWEIRKHAVIMAEGYLAARVIDPMYGNYNTAKAALSVMRSGNKKYNQIDRHTSQFGAGAKTSKGHYCSNFIFRCYAAAAEAVGLTSLPIPNSRFQISPRDLEGLLIESNDWHARGGGAAMSHP